MPNNWDKSLGRKAFRWYLSKFPLRDGKAYFYESLHYPLFSRTRSGTPALLQVGQGCPLDGQVVGFGPGGRENNALSRSADKPGHLGPLGLEDLFDFASQVIYRRRIAETLGELREHGL